MDEYVYRQGERKNRNDHRLKQAQIVEGLFNVTNVDENTIVIEKTARSIENVSRSRAVLAPKPHWESNVRKLHHSVKLAEAISSEEAKVNYIVYDKDDEDEGIDEESEAMQKKGSGSNTNTSLTIPVLTRTK